jgi:hypothetical protein
MPKTHFRSMEASQNKRDVTNRFGDRDFISAPCTFFQRNSNRFEVIRCIFVFFFKILLLTRPTQTDWNWPEDGTERMCLGTNRFGDRDFISAPCTFFQRNSNRFEVIRCIFVFFFKILLLTRPTQTDWNWPEDGTERMCLGTWCPMPDIYLSSRAPALHHPVVYHCLCSANVVPVTQASQN